MKTQTRQTTAKQLYTSNIQVHKHPSMGHWALSRHFTSISSDVFKPQTDAM